MGSRACAVSMCLFLCPHLRPFFGIAIRCRLRNRYNFRKMSQCTRNCKLDFVFTTWGCLYSPLCGLYADIFDYFCKLYSIKLKVSDLSLKHLSLKQLVCCIFIAHCLLWSNIHHSKISIPIRTCVHVFKTIKRSHCCSRWS